MVELSDDALRAFWAVWPSSAVPGFCAVESSSEMYLIVYSPTLPLGARSPRASFSPLITAVDWPRDVPCSGRLE